jgi:hypothetical protein
VPVIGIVIYTLAGYWVLSLVTGSTNIGDGSQLTLPGKIALFGPLVAYVLALVAGDRGPLAIFYRPRVTIRVDHARLSWSKGGSKGSLAWEDIGSIEASNAWTQAETAAVVDLAAHVVTRLPLGLVGTGGGHQRSLLDLAVETRPDLFARRRGLVTRAMVTRIDAAPRV